MGLEKFTLLDGRSKWTATFASLHLLLVSLLLPRLPPLLAKPHGRSSIHRPGVDVFVDVFVFPRSAVILNLLWLNDLNRVRYVGSTRRKHDSFPQFLRAVGFGQEDGFAGRPTFGAMSFFQ